MTAERDEMQSKSVSNTGRSQALAAEVVALEEAAHVAKMKEAQVCLLWGIYRQPGWCTLLSQFVVFKGRGKTER